MLASINLQTLCYSVLISHDKWQGSITREAWNKLSPVNSESMLRALPVIGFYKAILQIPRVNLFWRLSLKTRCANSTAANRIRKTFSQTTSTATLMLFDNFTLRKQSNEKFHTSVIRLRRHPSTSLKNMQNILIYIKICFYLNAP